MREPKAPCTFSMFSIYGNSVGSYLKYTGRQNKNAKVTQRGRGWKGDIKPKCRDEWRGSGCIAMETTGPRVVIETIVPCVVLETTATTPTPIKGASKLFLDLVVIRVAP